MQIVSQNDAVGRDRWEKILTIAYRDHDFVVAGFTYASRHARPEQCDAV